MSFIDLINNIGELEFRQPLWLLLMLQPLLLWLVIHFRNKQADNQFADEHLLPWVQVNDQKTWLQKLFSRDSAYWLSMVLLAIAMAGPRTPLELPDAKQASALDIMVVADVSNSMKVNDLKPSRLQRGAQELYELLGIIQRDDVRLGSVVYAARPHVYVPMTNDLSALKFYLKDLNELVLPTRGSDAPSALLMAGRELTSDKFETKKNDQKQAKAILWLTDGDFSRERDILNIEKVLKELKSKEISTYILGLGTETGGAIPLPQGGWLEQNGQGVISKMNANLLADLANISGGKFSKVSNDESDWNTLYTQGLLKSVISDNTAPAKSEDQLWSVYQQYFLFPGMLLLLFALVPFNPLVFLAKRVTNKMMKPQSTLSAFVITILIGFTFVVSNLEANENENKNTQATAQDPNSSEGTNKEPIKNITDPILLESVKNYNAENYDMATAGFMSIILNGESDSDRGKAMHNLGNNYFQQGDYGNAIKLYKDALRYAPDQTETQNNLALTTQLNKLLLRRRTRDARSRQNEADGREPVGNQNQVGNMTIIRQIIPKNIKLPEIPKDQLERLLVKGLAHLKMSGSASAVTALERQRKIQQAKISLLRDQDSSLEMWKRMFEIEEGFPAKLEAPKTIPGQQPW